MKRDKEWLIREIMKLPCEVKNGYHLVRLVDTFPLIDQIDEPEKVTIPQEASDWIESVRSLSNSMSCLMTYDQIKRFSHELTLWCYESGNNDNLHKLARAWLDGYEVEKEPLYYVKLPFTNSISEDLYLAKGTASGGYWLNTRYERDINDTCHIQHKFTEKQIRDYDERLWPFATEVES